MAVAKENLQKPLIKKELEAYQDDFKNKLGLTAEWMRKILKRVINSGVKLVSDGEVKSMVDAKSVISAIEVLNKMDGEYNRSKTEPQDRICIVFDELDMAL